jgi:iron complex outermembrane receptor protein
MTAGLILLSAPAVADAVVTAMEPPFETAASNQSAQRTGPRGEHFLLAQADTASDAQQVVPDSEPGAAATGPRAQAMEEVIVTSQRKAESIQDVPIAISAFTAEQIEDANLTNLDQIAPLTPGLFVGKFSETRPQIYIRGVGSRQFDVGSEGSVGVFLDEVYMGRFSAGLTGLADVERIEVLKGPQGTLYGRNTIGGAINVITQNPTDELTMKAEAGGGNMGYFTGQGVISGPLVEDRLFGRFSVSYRSRDGYVENLTTGTDHNALDQLNVRGKLLFAPTEDLDISFTLDYNRADPTGGLQGEYVAGLPVLATGGPLTPPLVTTPSRFDEFYNTDSELERDIYTAILRADWDLGGVRFTSISAYHDVDMMEARDLDSTSIDSIEHITEEQAEQFTQEIRFSSTDGGWLTFDDRVEWIAGFYYLKEKPIRFENLRGGLDSVFSMIAASIDAGGPPAPLAPGTMYIDNFLTVDVDTTSYALFGQATIDITDRLALTLGGRYTDDKKEAIYSGSSNRDFVPPIILPFQVDLERSWDSFDPKATVEYHWTDEAMTYFVYSEGFKSGGFQFAKFNAVEASEIFEPETVETYEVGLKSTWLDRRLRTNLSYFYYEYTDLQVPKTTTGAGGAPAITTLNAAQATVQGFEFDGTLSVTEGLTWHLGYAYLDATYDEYVFNADLDFSGNEMVRSPKHTFNTTLEYHRPIGNGQFGIRGDLSWTDKYFFEADEGLTPGTDQKEFALFNASVSYEIGSWRFSVWGKNLTDEVYRTTTLSFGAFTMEYLGLPRTYGASIGWTFD